MWQAARREARAACWVATERYSMGRRLAAEHLAVVWRKGAVWWKIARRVGEAHCLAEAGFRHSPEHPAVAGLATGYSKAAERRFDRDKWW
jgi:hypothetical protein